MKDRLFIAGAVPGSFRFDEKVADVFDDMLSRSIPHYGELQGMIAGLADDFCPPGGTIYDLGCSTATTLVNITGAIGDASVRLVGIDSSTPVLEKARQKIDAAGLGGRIELIAGDILDAPLENAGVVIMNYTLQFIPPDKRKGMLRRIHDALCPGGVLLLSEKVLEDDPELSGRFVEKYFAFKRSMGYSDLEIAAKREALDRVLVPLPMAEESALLRNAGFSRVSLFFKWFNFASFLACK